MRVAWDPVKAASNLKKHGVRFSDAEGVLFDSNAITEKDPGSDEERRFVTIGMDSVGRILVVAYCYRAEEIRIISARPATKREQWQYETGI